MAMSRPKKASRNTANPDPIAPDVGLQAVGAGWQELARVTPPLLPEEQWAPGSRVLQSPRVFAVEQGMILAPESPGLGLDVDEEALERVRVRR
jgi:L-alanine-DL-glutamate epimerase-like enolase superfamily enzyme